MYTRRMRGFILITAMFVIINLAFAGSIYLVFSIGKSIMPGGEFPILVFFFGLIALSMGFGFTFWFVRFIESLPRILARVRASIRRAPNTTSGRTP